MGCAAVPTGRHPVHHLWQPPRGQQGLQEGLPHPGGHIPAPGAWGGPRARPPPCLCVSPTLPLAPLHPVSIAVQLRCALKTRCAAETIAGSGQSPLRAVLEGLS